MLTEQLMSPDAGRNGRTDSSSRRKGRAVGESLNMAGMLLEGKKGGQRERERERERERSDWVQIGIKKNFAILSKTLLMSYLFICAG